MTVLLAHRVKVTGELEVRTSSGWFVIGSIARRGDAFYACHANGTQVNEVFRRRHQAVLALLQAWGMFRGDTSEAC
ncbi:hypothetical protein [Gulosibacter molinativorax]|uniref:Uncharacterized protein n=1 Tax=Gulosibacter molinativorax TaxID=256821 RepID=A0ABT7C795_9MICO|nr:hypothetical protein [Gulosibacter molinativorax]MDJ1370662.1 hypothetical protein [Gulosibacter molinativorax]QUY63312.1 Hypotetical protein [Gulosibacter molinativorax]